MSADSHNIKKVYKTPKLSDFGRLVDQTHGGGSGKNDSNGSETAQPSTK